MQAMFVNHLYKQTEKEDASNCPIFALHHYYMCVIPVTTVQEFVPSKPDPPSKLNKEICL